jgi:crossover junction endodeoxyribonuclease RuvC
MRVLGVDSGSRITGYGVIDIDGADCVFVDCGIIRVNAALALPLRLNAIHRRMAEVIESQQPDEAVFESVFYSANVQSALKLGHARGVCIQAAAAADLPVYEYSPAEVKSAVTGYGRAEKPQVQQMVRALLKLAELPETYDASDALAVAICHAHAHRFKKPWRADDECRFFRFSRLTVAPASRVLCSFLVLP